MRTVRGCLTFAALPLVIALVGFWLSHWVIHGQVDATSLHASVARATGGPGHCEREDGRWTCSVIRDSPECADPGSCLQGAEYRVTVARGSSCWTATQDEAPWLPSSVSGCVRLWEWSLLN